MMVAHVGLLAGGRRGPGTAGAAASLARALAGSPIIPSRHSTAARSDNTPRASLRTVLIMTWSPYHRNALILNNRQSG